MVDRFRSPDNAAILSGTEKDASAWVKAQTFNILGVPVTINIVFPLRGERSEYLSKGPEWHGFWPLVPLMNGSFSPPPRPALPVRPEMPYEKNLNSKCGMSIVAQNNIECALPPGIAHQYSADYRVVEACLMVAHYRGDLNLATRSSIAREVFERFGVALAEGDSNCLTSLVRGLPPPSSNAVPLNGVQVLSVAPNVVKHQSSQKLHDHLKQHKSSLVPSALPDRSPEPMVAWTEHWERYAPNNVRRWTFAGRLAEERFDNFLDASEEEQEQIKADLAAWAHQDSDEMFDKGCQHKGCAYAATIDGGSAKGKKKGDANFRHPSMGFQYPYGTEAGETRVLCGAHWQPAWMAYKLWRLTWSQYQRYGSKLQDVVVITKPCEGFACTNEQPPHNGFNNGAALLGGSVGAAHAQNGFSLLNEGERPARRVILPSTEGMDLSTPLCHLPDSEFTASGVPRALLCPAPDRGMHCRRCRRCRRYAHLSMVESPCNRFDTGCFNCGDDNHVQRACTLPLQLL